MNPNLVSHLNSELGWPFGNGCSIVGGMSQGCDGLGRTLPIAPAIDSLFTDFLEMENLARTWTDHWPVGLAHTAQENPFSSLPSQSRRDVSLLEALCDDYTPPSHWGINE